jgi:site-specific recombinase XerD
METLPWAGQEHGALFVGQHGPFARRCVGMIIQALGKRAGLQGALSPRRLRHTFATAAMDPAGCKLVREPVPLAVLQRFVGHRKIQTTVIYTLVSDDDLARFLEDEPQ